jgi:hypothetical protein
MSRRHQSLVAPSYGAEAEAIDACASPVVYVVSPNKGVTELLVPVGLHLMEKRVELEGLRAVGRRAA